MFYHEITFSSIAKEVILPAMEEQEKHEIHQEESAQKTENPKKEFKISTGAAIVLGASIIAVVLLFKLPSHTTTQVAQNNQPAVPTSVDPKILTVRATDHVHNDPAAAQVIAFEYSDSDCPFCQQFHTTMKQVFNDYGTKVAWVYRYFPLSIHPDAHNEALALECSAQLGGNDTFWKFLDKAFGVTVTPDQSAETMISIATSLNLDKKLFAQCLQNQATAARVNSDATEADSIGAQGTPFTILVNKKGAQVIIPGAYPYEYVKEQLDTLLK